MKRRTTLVVLVLALAMLLSACAAPAESIIENLVKGNDYKANMENLNNEIVSNNRIWPWEDPSITPPDFTGPVTEAGTVKSLKVLAIGDSSSKDAMQFLAKLAQEAGVKEIKIAILYRNGGGVFVNQWTDFNANNAAYTYYEDIGEGWVATPNAKPKDIVKSEKWDFVILHQNVSLSGDAKSISETSAVADMSAAINTLLRTDSSNPNKNAGAKILWMQVWAYEINSRNNLFNHFKNYGNDQKRMYTQGIDAIKAHVVPQKNIDGVIPVGTAIQNMRESYWSDGMTKDAEFLSNTGKVAAAVAMFKYLTGYDINGMEFSDSVFDHARPHLGVIIESANNAYLHPYEVTPSVYKTAN